ncbi:hypothetical protein [Gulosibacter bifidus]|uniref:Uncharacterized protein n=1 Tax=Gulosibacter bifidus TaxID=272239 RepID=A0ABW5RKV9_9MICO|nr:hypothetical protein [Gulosibacter bifidus]
MSNIACISFHQVVVDSGDGAAAAAGMGAGTGIVFDTDRWGMATDRGKTAGSVAT